MVGTYDTRQTEEERTAKGHQEMTCVCGCCGWCIMLSGGRLSTPIGWLIGVARSSDPASTSGQSPSKGHIVVEVGNQRPEEDGL